MADITDEYSNIDAPTNNRGYFTNLIRSAISSTGPELIGMQPMEGVEQFRTDNPVAGVLSILAPMALTYGAGVAAAPSILSKVPGLARAFEWSRAPETIAAMPYRAAASEGALLLAPLEAARLGGAAIAEGIADEPQSPLKNTAYSVGVDLALGAAIDTAITGFRHAIGQASDKAGVRKFLSTVPGIDVEAPSRKLLGEVDQFPVSAADQVYIKRGLQAEILNEANVPAGRYFDADLPGPMQPGADAASTKFGPNTVFGRSGFQPISSTTRFESVFDDIIKDSANPELNADNIWQHISQPTYREFDIRRGVDNKRVPDDGFVDPEISAAASRHAADSFKYKLDTSFKQRSYSGVTDPETKLNSGRGIWYEVEPATGLTTIAKELPGNRFVMFKTDRPSLFAPKGLFTEANNTRGGIVDLWTRSEREMVQNSIALSAMNDITKSVLSPESITSKGSKLSDTISNMVSAPVRQELRNISSKVGGELSRWFAPTSVQMARSPVAQRLFGINKMFHEQGRLRASELLYGKTTFASKDASTATSLLSANGLKRSGGLDDLVNSMSERDFTDFVDGLYREPSLQELKEAPWSDNVKSALVKLRGYFEEQAKDMQSLGRLDGAVTYRDDYYGSHIWRGDFRSPIVAGTDTSRVLYYGSGHTAKLANEDAKRLAAVLNADGHNVVATGKAFVRQDSGELSDYAIQNLLPKSSPEYQSIKEYRLAQIDEMRRRQFEKTRKGVGGHFADPARAGMQEVSWTKKEVMNMISNNIFARERLRADMSFKSHPDVRRAMGRLINNDPVTAKYLSEKISAEAGNKIGFFKIVDQYADKALTPILGANGATKVARAVNRTMYNLTFPLTDLAFPILNALTGLQTAVPEISFILGKMRHDPAALSKWYMSAPLMSRDGKVIDGVSYLDPLKFWKNGWTKMLSPEADGVYKEAVLRAINDGVVDPRFFEDFAGKKAQTIGEAFKPRAGTEFAESLIALNEYLPTQTEKLARLQAFTTAWELGRDVLKMEPDGLYMFAREFTNRTMYLYGMADRPALFGGAFGGTFGLFKTWMMNFVSGMMTYSKDAVLHGNFGPLLWMMANTSALAGVTATPIYNIIDGISSLTTDKTAAENMRRAFGYDETGQSLVDAVFYGLPSILGVTFNSRSTLPGTDVGRDIGQLFNFAAAGRMASLAQAAGTGIDHYMTTGELPTNDPAFRRQLIAATMPRSFVRASNIVDGNLISNRTGNTIIPDVGAPAAISSFLGFTPVSWQRAYELSDILYKRNESMRQQVESMGEALAIAVEERDTETYNKVSKDAIQLGIWDRVYSSYRSRHYKRGEPVTDRMSNPARDYELTKIYGG